MGVKHSYDIWAHQYDDVHNKTRDLEGLALKSVLADISFKDCLEIGCGTGKNTAWLVERAKHIIAVDLSEQMLSKAKEKISSERVTFQQTDITRPWQFGACKYDLITFSLVLEHIEHLDNIFREIAQVLVPGGYVYIGELHPFRQYSGSKARFDTDDGPHVVTCFNHNISDFTQPAGKFGLDIVDINEFFDDNDRNSIPRILTLLLKKR